MKSLSLSLRVQSLLTPLVINRDNPINTRPIQRDFKVWHVWPLLLPSVLNMAGEQMCCIPPIAKKLQSRPLVSEKIFKSSHLRGGCAVPRPCIALEMGKNSNPAKTNPTGTRVLPKTEPNTNPKFRVISHLYISRSATATRDRDAFGRSVQFSFPSFFGSDVNHCPCPCRSSP